MSDIAYILIVSAILALSILGVALLLLRRQHPSLVNRIEEPRPIPPTTVLVLSQHRAQFELFRREYFHRAKIGEFNENVRLVHFTMEQQCHGYRNLPLWDITFEWDERLSDLKEYALETMCAKEEEAPFRT